MTNTDTDLTEYTVVQRMQYPAWDEKDGIRYTVTARSKGDAVKKARRVAWDYGNTGGGLSWFTATEGGR